MLVRKKNCAPILPNLTYVNLHIQISIYHPYLGESRASTYSAAAVFGTERESTAHSRAVGLFCLPMQQLHKKIPPCELKQNKNPHKSDVYSL